MRSMCRPRSVRRAPGRCGPRMMGSPRLSSARDFPPSMHPWVITNKSLCISLCSSCGASLAGAAGWRAGAWRVDRLRATLARDAAVLRMSPAVVPSWSGARTGGGYAVGEPSWGRRSFPDCFKVDVRVYSSFVDFPDSRCAFDLIITVTAAGAVLGLVMCHERDRGECVCYAQSS